MDKLLSREKDFLRVCEKTFSMLSVATVTAQGFYEFVQGEMGPALAHTYVDYMAVKEVARTLPSFVEELRTKHLARKYVAKIKGICFK